MSLSDAANRAAQAIRAKPSGTRWFLDCDSDADGLTAAVVMAQALGRIGHGYQVRASRDKTTDAYASLAAEACDGYILLDKGTSHADQLANLSKETGRPVIIVDHHNVPNHDSSPVILVNPRLEGMDGSRDASAGTTAVAVALALSSANLDLAPVGLSGAVGDWQHQGGWQGWNQEMVERAMQAGHMTRVAMPALIGVDLGDALARRSKIPAPHEWLAKLGINGQLDAEDLDVESRTRLLSAWTLWDLEHGIEQERVQELLWNVKLDTGVRHAFRVVDACGRLGRAELGIGFLLGSPKARQEAQEFFLGYKKWLGEALGDLRKLGVTTMSALQHARTKEPALTGMVAGIGVVHVIDDLTKPLVVCAPRPDGDLQVSTRGTHEQVEAGMDLGLAIQVAAAHVKAEGGGHPIASGAVIKPESYDEFLANLDEALKAQGFLAVA